MTALLLTKCLLCFKSLTDIPVMYERNAGYKGKEHGDTNDNSPAPNARK